MEGQSSGHTDSLALSPGKLVRITTHVFTSQANHTQKLQHSLLSFPSPLKTVDQQGFAYDVRNCFSWVKRRKRVLEDNLHILSQVAELLFVKGKDILFLKKDFTR